MLFGFVLLVYCRAPEARRAVSSRSGSFIKSSIKRNKSLAKQEEAKIQMLIQKDSLRYIESQTGFWYAYLQKDSLPSKRPEFGDLVRFTYQVSDLDGHLIYSKKELDTINYAIDKQELFLGLREGLKLMKKGERVSFMIPSYQAYGYYGDEKKIGRNIPLKIQVHLHDIKKLLKN